MKFKDFKRKADTDFYIRWEDGFKQEFIFPYNRIKDLDDGCIDDCEIERIYLMDSDFSSSSLLFIDVKIIKD